MLIITLSDGLSLPTGDDFVSKVFPNIWAFLVQLLAFIIMSIIVIKFAYKPVKNFLHKEENMLKNIYLKLKKQQRKLKIMLKKQKKI